MIGNLSDEEIKRAKEEARRIADLFEKGERQVKLKVSTLLAWKFVQQELQRLVYPARIVLQGGTAMAIVPLWYYFGKKLIHFVNRRKR